MNARHRALHSTAALDERDIERLQAMLDALPAPLEPLDTSMLDGYLCGVLLQPQPAPTERWLPHVTDADGRALPAGFDALQLHALVLRRHAELGAAIAHRQWFDPWVFELEAATAAPAAGDADNEAPDNTATSAREAVYPWVAGFAAAMELFPDLMNLPAPALLEPLALLYRHLAPEDLEDADELLAVIESLEPPANLAQAVEELVRATLLLADASHPQASPAPRHRARQRPRSSRR
jgi:uncharacterized protein